MKISSVRFLSLCSLAAVVVAAGCNPVFAPPMRSVHFGSPRTNTGTRVEVSGAGNLLGSGGPTVSLPVSPRLAVDLGSDMRFVDNENWIMGTAGVRYTAVGDIADPTGFFLDLELGGGAGTGGVDDGESNTTTADISWTNRFAFGAYGGVGVGYNFFSWFGWFVRGRAQVTKAEHIPTTFSGAGVTGPQFNIGPVSIHASVGIAGFCNSTDSQVGQDKGHRQGKDFPPIVNVENRSFFVFSILLLVQSLLPAALVWWSLHGWGRQADQEGGSGQPEGSGSG